ncbi:hypothetical protein AVEN_68446-1 [Araneus ventricosus]|uniref:Uncharacterized protein n=1 Tax=Araneus ventricosus TaxID=182803 RepID=A0A4Y2LER1_ARAVE|nr:hypothetical protein AVEN_68446-1 [Araneus ventricosus]
MTIVLTCRCYGEPKPRSEKITCIDICSDILCCEWFQVRKCLFMKLASRLLKSPHLFITELRTGCMDPRKHRHHTQSFTLVVIARFISCHGGKINGYCPFQCADGKMKLRIWRNM